MLRDHLHRVRGHSTCGGRRPGGDSGGVLAEPRGVRQRARRSSPTSSTCLTARNSLHLRHCTSNTFDVLRELSRLSPPALTAHATLHLCRRADVTLERPLRAVSGRVAHTRLGPFAAVLHSCASRFCCRHTALAVARRHRRHTSAALRTTTFLRCAAADHRGCLHRRLAPDERLVGRARGVAALRPHCSQRRRRRLRGALCAADGVRPRFVPAQ